MRAEIKERIERIKNGEVPEGYIETRIGILPDGWKIMSMYDVSVKITDGTHDTPKTVEDGIPYITAIHVKNGCIDYKNCYFVTLEDHKKIYARCNPEHGDLAIVNIGAGTASAAMVNVNFEFSMKNVALVKPNISIIDPKFLELYQLYKKNSLFNRLTSGGAQPFLSLKEIGKLKISAPSLTEQQCIATILSTWDKAIVLKGKLIEQKKKQKRGLMQALLTGKVRLPGFEEKWKEVRLGDIFSRVTRKNSDGNVNVMTISAQRGLINQEDFFNKSVASNILDNYYLLLKGEFAYNKSYSNGYPMGAIKRLNLYDSGVVTTLYICFNLKEGFEKNSDYFEQYFESGLLNESLIQIAHEGGRAHGLLNVSLRDFFNMTITVPDEEERIEISSILCAADKEIGLFEQELGALKLQKKGLMQLLLSGIVRVPN